MTRTNIDSFLNKVSPFGIVTLGFAASFLFISYIPKETGFSGAQGLVDFLLSWWSAIALIILFVSLNIFSSFSRRKNAIIGFAIISGALLAIELFAQGFI